MRKTEGPETKIRSGVGDPSEHELDGVNDLVDKDLSKIEILRLAHIKVILYGIGLF